MSKTTLHIGQVARHLRWSATGAQCLRAHIPYSFTFCSVYLDLSYGVIWHTSQRNFYSAVTSALNGVTPDIDWLPCTSPHLDYC